MCDYTDLLHEEDIFLRCSDIAGAFICHTLEYGFVSAYSRDIWKGIFCWL